MHKIAVEALDERIKTMGNETPMAWRKIKISADSFCNIVFETMDAIYVVLPVLSEGIGGKSGKEEIDGIPGIVLLKEGARFLPNPVAVEQVLTLCEENNMVPCFFPLDKEEDGSLKPAVEGWNLWSIEHGNSIDPAKEVGKAQIRVSDWEAHRDALCKVMAYIEDEMGGKIMFYHDTAPIAPQIFFTDAEGHECCATVEVYFKGREPFAFQPAPPALKERMANCRQYKARVGFCAKNMRDGRPYRHEGKCIAFDAPAPLFEESTATRSRCAQVLLGVIAGDMIGSIYEGRHSHIKHKEGWPLFKGPAEYEDGASHFTDDTTMTLAICKALLDSAPEFHDLPGCTVAAMQSIGRKYFWGFGGRFRHWVRSDDPQPYGSYGNGAAMRVSACALAGRSIEEVQMLARAVTSVTHNHPEGYKGAEAVAVCIFLALQGKTPTEVQAYCHEHYYPMDFMVDDIRAGYTFDVSCQGSVPQALKAALEGPDYESAVRSCVALGGDADTQAAIAGGLAAALYGLPDEIAEQAWQRLPQEDLREIFQQFEKRFATLEH